MTPPFPLGIRIGTLVDGLIEDPAAYIESILEHGFESFQITFWKRIPADLDLERLAGRIREILEPSGAIISSVGVYGNPLESDEDADENRNSWGRLIDAAHRFGANTVSGFAGRLRGRPIDASMARFAEIFGPFSERAGEKDLCIAFENCAMGGSWNSGDWNIAHGPDAWDLMFEAVPADNMGLEWEPCHQMINLIDPVGQLREWVPRIFHVHGKCATIHHDVIRKTGIHGSIPHAHHRTPGFGDADWTELISILRQAGYQGTIDIEGWHDPVYRDELEMTGQVHALHYLKRCRGGKHVPNP